MHSEKFILIGIFALLLFNAPLVSIFNHAVLVTGIPLLYLSFFVIWMGLIVVYAFFLGKRYRD